ncbi:MAG: glycosyltransferase family 87 protein [Gemmataceae bacterium]
MQAVPRHPPRHAVSDQGGPDNMDVSPTIDSRQEPLRRAERCALAAFFLILALFAVLVEHRSALQHTRKGDLNVFLRAGWAVRSGANLYAVTDDNGFHYHYPPLLALLVAPLADAPAGADRTNMVPYAVSVAVCYLLNLLLLAFAVHQLARALERATDGGLPLSWPAGSRGWWALRMTPILACIIPIGHTLSRGQVNLLLLALFAGFLADLLNGRHFRAGLWLSGAICVKIIPAYLVLLPLWRRDGRCLAGCAAGLVLGLLLIPAVFLGPTRTVECYRDMTRTVLLPGLGNGDDASRAEELTNQTATEGQSILTALHNTLHYDLATRPRKASPQLRHISYLIGGLLTLTVLGVFGWRRRGDGIDLVLFFGLLVVNMLLISPVCHLHYFSLLLPLAMALVAERCRTQAGLSPGPWLFVVLIGNGVANLLPQMPDMNIFRDCGSAMYGSLLMWTMGVAVLARRRSSSCAAMQETLQARAA